MILFKTNWNNLNIPVPYWTFYNENISVENGKLKISWKIDPTNPSHRPRVVLHDIPLDYYMRGKFVLPSENHGWFVFFEPMAEDGTERLYFQLVLDSNYRLVAELKNVSTGEFIQSDVILQTRPDAELDIKVHVKRDSVDGMLEVWVNGQKCWEFIGKTMLYPDARCHAIILDCYKGMKQPLQTVYQDWFIYGTELVDMDVSPEPEPSGDSRFLYWSLLGAFGIVLIVLLASSGMNKSD